MIAALAPREEARFWSKVRKADGCWLWIPPKNTTGYGQVWIHGRHRMAHHVAWFIENGEWPGSGDLEQRCRNRACVRIHPGHVVERLRASVVNSTSARVICGRGHTLTPATIYVVRGQTRCRECERERWQERWIRGLWRP